MRLVTVAVILATSTLPGTAQTYISAEPIPSGTVVGETNRAAIENLGYPDMALWAQRLAGCGLVNGVVNALVENRAITTLSLLNTRYQVAAGGFEGVTDPSYVFMMVDSGPVAVKQSDVWILDNALGYALNQDGTAQFSLREHPRDPNEFPLAYAVITLPGKLSGERAQSFFNYLGTIDANLGTRRTPGLPRFRSTSLALDNSMLRLIGDVSTSEFETGLFRAAATTAGAIYSPLDNAGNPTVATAGAAFPGNDWSAFPDGSQYLANIPNSPRLVSELEALRKKHLAAVTNLLAAIAEGDVANYLHAGFRCPRD